jgi:hypothetical protein
MLTSPARRIKLPEPLPRLSSLAQHRAARSVSALLCLSLLGSCMASGSGAAASTPTSAASSDAEFVRYRLPLRDNPVVDSGQALHCYTACQPEATPEGYLHCLEACPGFETTEGARCTSAEVPPVAVCLTARRLPRMTEPEPGSVVIATIAGIVVVVALASVCATSNSQCYATGPGLP